MLCFGFAASLVPALSRRVGQETLLLAVVVVIAAGTAVRLAPSVGPLFLGTFLVGVAIAVGNVLMPSIIKRHVLGFFTFTRHSSLAQPKGSSLPSRSWMASFRFGSMMHMPRGSQRSRAVAFEIISPFDD